jgi:hypothetical protein
LKSHPGPTRYGLKTGCPATQGITATLLSIFLLPKNNHPFFILFLCHRLKELWIIQITGIADNPAKTGV